MLLLQMIFYCFNEKEHSIALFCKLELFSRGSHFIQLMNVVNTWNFTLTTRILAQNICSHYRLMNIVLITIFIFELTYLNLNKIKSLYKSITLKLLDLYSCWALLKISHFATFHLIATKKKHSLYYLKSLFWSKMI